MLEETLRKKFSSFGKKVIVVAFVSEIKADRNKK